MAVDKKINYAIQGGGPNYLGKQKMVKAPKKWKSSPTHPEAHLAYITDKEQDLLIKKNLYGSLKGKPNRGPAGIVSLQGDLGGYDASPGGADSPGRGGGDNEAQNIAAQNAARTKAVLTGKIQRGPTTGNWEAGRNLGRRDSLAGIGLGQGNINIGRSIRGDLGGRRSRMGGILGALGRGALSLFGGIPGRIASGYMTAKNWAGNKGSNLWSGVQDFGEEVDEFGNYKTLDRYLNRGTNKYDNKPYLGEGQAEGGRIGYKWGSSDPEEPAEDIREIMQDQNIPFSEQVEGDPFQMRIQELMGKGLSYDDAYGIAEMEFQDLFAEGSEQDQGIASLV